MSSARRGRHRPRSARATARAVGLPALIALAGALVASVPNYAAADGRPPVVGGPPPTRSCQGTGTPSAPASASISASLSASPSGSVSTFGTPSVSVSASASASASVSASGSQDPTTSAPPTASASPTVTATPPRPGPCKVTRPGKPTPTATATRSHSAAPSTSQPASPSRSATTSTPAGSTPSTGSSGTEQTQPPVVGQEPYGPITRAQIMQRALAWVEQKVPYSQTSWWVDYEGSYRQDCSGYVSMAWGLDQAIDFWTGNLDTVSYQVPAAQLLPGDILLSTTHTVLFAGWADSAHTMFDFYEESHPGTVAHYVTGASLAAYLNAGFIPYRYDGVVGSNTGPYITPTAGVPITALGPLPQVLAPEGKTVQAPPPASWQTLPTPWTTPRHAAPSTPAAAVQEADLEPAAAAIPEQEAGSVGVAVGGSALLFTGLSLALTRRRAVRAAGARPRRRH